MFLDVSKVRDGLWPHRKLPSARDTSLRWIVELPWHGLILILGYPDRTAEQQLPGKFLSLRFLLHSNMHTLSRVRSHSLASSSSIFCFSCSSCIFNVVKVVFSCSSRSAHSRTSASSSSFLQSSSGCSTPNINMYFFDVSRLELTG